jgi:creatinine amidohydrolase/Fe(II)-dependent formamide hydrolase-like protein
LRFGNLTSAEVHKCAVGGWIAVLPTGCTEQQGPHLPVDFDSWFSEALCVEATAAIGEQASVNGLVLPALPFGPTPEHRNYGSGYIDLPQHVHELVVSCVLESLAEQGFRRLVVWRGCGQHNLTAVVERFNTRQKDAARAYQPELPYHEIWCSIGDPSVPGGHADSFATSIALHLRPETVRQKLISDPHSTPVNWQDPNLDFSRYSSTGVIGNPTQANAELGRKLWQAAVERVRFIFSEIASAPLK